MAIERLKDLGRTDESEDNTGYNRNGEVPDIDAQENINLSHAIAAKFKDLIPKIHLSRKATGEFVISVAVLAAISFKVYEMLHKDGKSHSEILDTFDPQHLVPLKNGFKSKLAPRNHIRIH